MSASNWDTCPRCEAAAAEKQRQRERKVRASYGKVSEEKYLAMLAKVKDEMKPLKDTLREDYELGLSGYAFVVSYRCSCTVCGFSFEYKHQEDVPVCSTANP